ncbi:MAG TPA: PAS domain S-box protein [Steroidobacteraceae bacterium]|nr:PAS domain S-box protein [Steroidobacteraceae bacterium]
MISIPAELARSALDAAPDAMIIIDAAGIVRYANRQVSALFGYAHDDVIGQNVEHLMPERFRARHVGHRESYTHNVRIRPMGAGLALFGQRQDGKEFPIEISLSPIHDGERVLVAAAIRDVTDRKRDEAELVIAREAAEQAREAADRANLAKSRFLATASHDLRQPLQTLALLNGTLQRMIKDPEPFEAIEQQEQAIGAMSRLLNALLDISKLESGAIKPEPADFTVAALFEELQREFATSAAGKGLQLAIENSGSVIHSDPSLVEQVLRNLVSNAIKYTHQGQVRVRCVGAAALIRIEVHDTGIGIPKDQIPFICEEFYQVGVATHSLREGYGLGLNIVQRIVNLLDLRLEVKSEVGKGSMFALTLPAGTERVRTGQNTSNAASVSPPPLATRQRILLVEDDPAVRDATRMLLKVDGYLVTAVSCIAEALQAAASETIDLLITDYHLGGEEVGTALITALRGRLGDTLKTVLMTGDTSSAVKELPADPYLRIASKPIKADELLTILRSFPTG